MQENLAHEIDPHEPNCHGVFLRLRELMNAYQAEGEAVPRSQDEEEDDILQ